MAKRFVALVKDSRDAPAQYVLKGGGFTDQKIKATPFKKRQFALNSARDRAKEGQIYDAESI